MIIMFVKRVKHTKKFKNHCASGNMVIMQAHNWMGTSPPPFKNLAPLSDLGYFAGFFILLPTIHC